MNNDRLCHWGNSEGFRSPVRGTGAEMKRGFLIMWGVGEGGRQMAAYSLTSPQGSFQMVQPLVGDSGYGWKGSHWSGVGLTAGFLMP